VALLTVGLGEGPFQTPPSFHFPWFHLRMADMIASRLRAYDRLIRVKGKKKRADSSNPTRIRRIRRCFVKSSPDSLKPGIFRQIRPRFVESR